VRDKDTVTAAPDAPGVRIPEELTRDDMDDVAGGVLTGLRGALLMAATEKVQSSLAHAPTPGGPVPIPYPNTGVMTDKS
jgi:hypothetical protein